MIDSISTWLSNAAEWLDRKGRPAWIITMVLGFVFFWPVGLFILFYMIWSNRMSCNSKKRHSRRSPFKPTGNVAFDEYREETLRRLEEEQSAFHGFLDRLRAAKDKAEFDQFVNERRTAPSTPGTESTI